MLPTFTVVFADGERKNIDKSDFDVIIRDGKFSESGIKFVRKLRDFPDNDAAVYALTRKLSVDPANTVDYALGMVYIATHSTHRTYFRDLVAMATPLAVETAFDFLCQIDVGDAQTSTNICLLLKLRGEEFVTQDSLKCAREYRENGGCAPDPSNICQNILAKQDAIERQKKQEEANYHRQKAQELEKQQQYPHFRPFMAALAQQEEADRQMQRQTNNHTNGHLSPYRRVRQPNGMSIPQDPAERERLVKELTGIDMKTLEMVKREIAKI